MRKKNKIKRNINLNLIIIFLLIIFLIKSDFFRKSYFYPILGVLKNVDAQTFLCEVRDTPLYCTLGSSLHCVFYFTTSTLLLWAF